MWGKRHTVTGGCMDYWSWGKRHSGRLVDSLQDETAKKSSWSKNNVKMWGKRNYDRSDDDGDDYAGYDWLDQVDPGMQQHSYPKRESKSPSSVDERGQGIPKSWANNDWGRNNVRIWG